MKNVTLLGGLLLFLLTLSACLEQGINTQNITGKWLYEGETNKGFDFKSDGTFIAWADGRTVEGDWILRGGTMLCEEGENKSWHDINLIGDTLLWDRSFLVRASTRALLDRYLVAGWKYKGSIQETFEFFEDGSYHYFGEKESDFKKGKWYVRNNRIVLDKNEAGGEVYRLNGKELIWGADVYTKLENKIPDTELTKSLMGSWYSDDLGQGLLYTFSPKGRFTVYDGRYESKGSWQVSKGKLILDNDQGSAEEVRISGNRLQWGEDLFQRTNKDEKNIWQFEKENGNIVAKSKDGKVSKVVVRDIPAGNQQESYKILSSVGPYVCLEWNYVNKSNPRASGRSYVVYNGQSGEKVRLMELFEEEDLLKAYLNDEVVLANIKGKKTPTSIRELIERVDGGCKMDMKLNLLESFAFHHLSEDNDEISVHIALPNVCKGEEGELTKLGLYLPIPAELAYYFNYAKVAGTLQS